jgi:hypothetical protein
MDAFVALELIPVLGIYQVSKVLIEKSIVSTLTSLEISTHADSKPSVCYDGSESSPRLTLHIDGSTDFIKAVVYRSQHADLQTFGVGRKFWVVFGEAVRARYLAENVV